jgi:hypothetical protein
VKRTASARAIVGYGAEDREVPVTRIAYEIRVAGVVPDSVLEELEGLTSTVQPVGTILYGPVPDEAALHGILNRLHAFGLRLIEVRRLPEEEQSGEISVGVHFGK